MNYQRLYETDLKMKKVIYRDINDGIERGLKVLDGFLVETKEDFNKYIQQVNNLIEVCQPEEISFPGIN